MMMTTANHGETQDKNNAIGAGDCDAASCGTHDTQCNRFSMMDDFLSILVPSLTVIICRLCCTNATTQSPQQTLSLSLSISLLFTLTLTLNSRSLSLSLVSIACEATVLSSHGPGSWQRTRTPEYGSHAPSRHRSPDPQIPNPLTTLEKKPKQTHQKTPSSGPPCQTIKPEHEKSQPLTTELRTPQTQNTKREPQAPESLLFRPVASISTRKMAENTRFVTSWRLQTRALGLGWFGAEGLKLVCKGVWNQLGSAVMWWFE